MSKRVNLISGSDFLIITLPKKTNHYAAMVYIEDFLYLFYLNNNDSYSTKNYPNLSKY